MAGPVVGLNCQSLKTTAEIVSRRNRRFWRPGMSRSLHGKLAVRSFAIPSWTFVVLVWLISAFCDWQASEAFKVRRGRLDLLDRLEQPAEWERLVLQDSLVLPVCNSRRLRMFGFSALVCFLFIIVFSTYSRSVGPLYFTFFYLFFHCTFFDVCQLENFSHDVTLVPVKSYYANFLKMPLT